MKRVTKVRALVGVVVVVLTIGIVTFYAREYRSDEPRRTYKVPRAQVTKNQPVRRTFRKAPSIPKPDTSPKVADESRWPEGMMTTTTTRRAETRTQSIAGDSSDRPTQKYHQTYDTVVDIALEIEGVLSEIKTIRAEQDQLLGEWKQSFSESGKEPTEEDYIEVKLTLAPLWEQQQELKGEVSSLVGELDAAVPGAVRTESVVVGEKEGVVYTEDVARIDYEHIRSMLGPVPQEIDIYLAGFAESFSQASGK